MSVGDILTGVLGGAGLAQGAGQQKTANSQLALQQQALQAANLLAQQYQQNQQGLFNQAQPAYGPALNQLLYNAGLGGTGAYGGLAPYGTIGGNPGQAGIAGSPGYNPAAPNYGVGGVPGAGATIPGGNFPEPTLQTPVGTYNGRQVAGFGSRRTSPAFRITEPIGTPVAPINTTGRPTPGYNGPLSTTPGQTTYGAQGPGSPSYSATPGVLNSALGVYNLPQQQLQYQAAKESIDQATKNANDALRFNLGVQGAGPNTTAAALARNQESGLENEAAFRRGLATNAPDIQNQRIGQLLGTISPGLAAGTNTAPGQLTAGLGGQYGQAGQYSQGLANQTFGQVGQGVQANQQRDALQNYTNALSSPNRPAGTNFQNQVPTGPLGGAPIPGSPGTVGAQFAEGGPIHAGQVATVGEKGPETFIPKKFFGQISDMLHHAYLMGNGSMQSVGKDLTTQPVYPNAQNYDPRGTGRFINSGAQALGQLLLSHSVPSTAMSPQTQQQYDTAQNYMATLGSPEMTVPGSPGYIQPRNMGGTVNTNQPYRVGESGTEIFVPKQNGFIIPNPATVAQQGPHSNINRLFDLMRG